MFARLSCQAISPGERGKQAIQDPCYADQARRRNSAAIISTENNWMNFPVLGLGADVLEMSRWGKIGLKWGLCPTSQMG